MFIPPSDCGNMHGRPFFYIWVDEHTLLDCARSHATHAHYAQAGRGGRTFTDELKLFSSLLSLRQAALHRARAARAGDFLQGLPLPSRGHTQGVRLVVAALQ